MPTRIKFLGAAQNVTGSCYLLDTGSAKIIVDCGMYQERKLRERNWDPFPISPQSIDAVLLTHAHLDHCGRVPKLVKEGFKGKIFCTPATADIAKIVMLDSGKIQEEDAKYKKKRHAKEGRTPPRPVVPLYTIQDAEKALPLFSTAEYEESVDVAPGIKACFRDAGHILGSSSIKVTVTEDGKEKSIIFSGDVGRWDAPILEDPTLPEEADYVLIESTYGNRTHKDSNTIAGSIETIINETYKAGGNIVIPSFAVERTQELVYYLSGLLSEEKIPRIPVFVDSPMAVRVTEVFQRHPELFDEDAKELLREGKHPCDFPNLTLSRTVDESKSINTIKGSSIIISASGMCTAGRIKHHLSNNITSPENTILFIGYQAHGTLGRIILEGAEEVRIFGRKHPVKARIERINGFSAHADRDDLHKWISSLKQAPKEVFVIHGEPDAAKSFAAYLKDKNDWNTSVPSYLDEVELK